nr:reverse transcriptase domain-containing protein [Tanacetum cinerariifolium]
MDQMLERLARNEYYCFFDGFSGYFQIPIDPQDQEKTIFTCPYGTFSYRRMPFGLCNAPSTFQRYMMAIFHDMIEKMMEVFMDDFSVSGNLFRTCLSHLDKMLKRCEDTNLCLNWEKSHFMVKEGIVPGHKISKNRIEVNKAKVDVIAKLPHPTTLKGLFGASGSPGASGSSQVPPPPPPPPSTNQEGQSKGSAAPSSSKTATSAEYQAWMMTDIRLRPSILLTPIDLQIDDDMAPNKQAHSSDDEDIMSAHIPKVNLWQDWWKPLEEERPATPEPADPLVWTIHYYPSVPLWHRRVISNRRAKFQGEWS